MTAERRVTKSNSLRRQCDPGHDVLVPPSALPEPLRRTRHGVNTHTHTFCLVTSVFRPLEVHSSQHLKDIEYTPPPRHMSVTLLTFTLVGALPPSLDNDTACFLLCSLRQRTQKQPSRGNTGPVFPRLSELSWYPSVGESGS